MIAAPMLIVAANPHATRFFLRRRKSGGIEELADHADCADFLEMHGQRLSPLQTRGGRTMVKSDARLADEETEIFLRRVASEVDAALAENSTASLALVAPPHVLCRLRDLISPASRSRLVRELCEDVVQSGLKEIEALAA